MLLGSHIIAAAILAASCVAPAAVAEPRRIDARLVGHAIMPALSFTAPPPDAPEAFAVSGRFAAPGNMRVDEPYSVSGRTWIGPADAVKRATGLKFPFVGQPLQGFSGVHAVGDGSYWTVSDNGFGSKASSPDVMLMAHRIRPDWKTGAVEVLETIFLHDPDRVLPFRLTNEFTDLRYLTGADLDLEAIRLVGDRLWFGDEFGPFVVSTDRSGRVLSVHETMVDGRILRSPDHPSMRLPGRPGAVRFDMARSRGFEGVAQSPDGSTLYAMLEGPLVEDGEKDRHVLHTLAFDVARGAFDGRFWLYPLENAGHAIGDFTMISPSRGLVIERDGGEGDPAQACADGVSTDDCFYRPARFKRVYLVELGGPGTVIDKLAFVDLMAIADPDGVARSGPGGGLFTFPFVTVESVDKVDAHHIIVANDNNLPFSSGRDLRAADDNEWALIDVGDMLTD